MSPLAGNAGRGQNQLAKWLNPVTAQIQTDEIMTMDAEDVRHMLADIDTARAHAISVFDTVRALRPDVKVPEIR